MVLQVAYAIVWLEPSWHCGPFSDYARIFHVLTQRLQRLTPAGLQWVLSYVASPGVVIPLLVLLTLVIYYLVIYYSCFAFLHPWWLLECLQLVDLFFLLDSSVYLLNWKVKLRNRKWIVCIFCWLLRCCFVPIVSRFVPRSRAHPRLLGCLQLVDRCFFFLDSPIYLSNRFRFNRVFRWLNWVFLLFYSFLPGFIRFHRF